MAPCKPLAYSAGSNPVSKFEDAFVVTKHRPPPGRTFHFHVVLRPQHPRMRDLLRSGKKPPTHFHPRQWEFFRVVRGSLTVEIDGRPHAFTAEDGEYALRPGPHHCLYATEGQRSEVCFFFFLLL
jgi:mannose-6-phosphate isomerase-like protein (cupin superfamily)